VGTSQPQESRPSRDVPDAAGAAGRARAAEQEARREADSIERRVGFQMLGLGWQMTAEVLAGAFLGWGVDHFFGTGPKGVLVGSLVGIAVAVYSLVRGGLRLYKSVDRADAMRRTARIASEAASASASGGKAVAGRDAHAGREGNS
jgi:ATP synthase protein I